MEQTKTKTCAHCGQEKPVSEFYKDKHTKDGLQSWCKQCSNARSNSSRRKPVKGDLDAAKKAMLQAMDEYEEQQQDNTANSEKKPLTAQEMFIATIDWEQRIFDTASRIFAEICAVANPNENTYKLCREYASQFVSDYREHLMFGTDEESKV